MKRKIVFLLIPALLASCSSDNGGSASDPYSEIAPSSSQSSLDQTSETESSSEKSSIDESGVSTSEATSYSGETDYEIKTADLYKPVYDTVEEDYAPEKIGTLSYLIDPEIGEDRAFLSVSSFADVMVEQTYTIDYNETGATFTFSGNMGTFSIAREDGTCTFSNLPSFGSLGAENPLDLGDTYKGTNPHAKIKTQTLYAPESTTISLSDYDLPYYFQGGDVYLPTTIVGHFFLYGIWSSITFNGTNFFTLDDCQMLRGGNANGRNDFSELYYGTSTMAQENTIPAAQAELDLNTFMFTLDHLYGFIEKEEYANGFRSWLEVNYPTTLSGLGSTDVETSLSAYDTLIRTVMGDGHTGLYNTNGSLGSFYNEGQHNVSSSCSHSQRVIDLSVTANRLYAQRYGELGLSSYTDLGDKYLEIKDKTAIIRFDSFVNQHVLPNQTDFYYESYASTDLYSRFYTAYKKIEEAGTVEDVIIDITCNGGGDSTAMIEALGFIVDEVDIDVYENFSHTGFEATYMTDCNGDGEYTEGESPAGSYNQYVLTSNYSFSCGNAFPYYAKKGGVKTIGATSGGGGYAILPMMLSNGYPIVMSGPISLGRSSLDEPNIDGGVTPDIEIPEADYYSIDKLAEYISAA